ncbi:Lrp/AsnC ligand binding domain-containing protein [Nocardioides sp.]|uniref:Lrp/AsnC ligand binding domain-containing protein n=1 Tax=Nocardioides sp. TaxID=35761 RepID=UPI0039E22F6C
MPARCRCRPAPAPARGGSSRCRRAARTWPAVRRRRSAGRGRSVAGPAVGRRAGRREIGEAVPELPEVGFVAAMSGRDNLVASLSCRDLAHLYEFVSGRIGGLAGIESMETLIFQRLVKQSGGLVADGRLVRPALTSRR